MKNTTKIITLLILTIISTSLSQEIEKEENVLVLNTSNFDSAVQTHQFLLVEFYAPWCGHCKALAPEYASAATTLLQNNSKVFLAKVDVTAERELGERYNIEGFPTLKFFISGKDVEYNGGRTADDIVSWVEKRSGPSYVNVNSDSEFTTLQESSNVLVGYFGSEEGKLFEAFKEIAMVYDQAKFFHSDNSGFAQSKGVQSGNLVVFKNYDEKQTTLNVSTLEEVSVDSVFEFIEQTSMKLVSPFNEATAEFVFGRSKTGVFLYRDPTKHSELDAVFQTLAPEFKGKLFFVANGITEDLEEKLAEYIGVTESDLPVVKIHDVKTNEVLKFTLKNEINVENVRNFINEFLEGKLSAEFKSEEVPASAYEENSHVYNVVGKSFKDVVLDETKDVLVMFYAPWCGHCQALKPKYENLAEKLKEYKNIVIAKIDSTANEVSGQEVEAYPTLRFFGSKSKEGKDVEGARDEYHLLQFLREQELVTPIGEEVVFEKPAEEEEVEEGEEDMEEGEEVEGKSDL